MIRNNLNYVLIFCALLLGVSVSAQSDYIEVSPTKWGTGPWLSGGANYSFIAESGNDAILARGVSL